MTARPRATDRPVIVEALRTPIGRAGGALRAVPAADLAAPVLAAVAGRLAREHPSEPVVEGRLAQDGPPGTGSGGRLAQDGRIDEVILGNCMGPGGDVARVAALAAGLGVEVPALTVDRQCGSGLAAVVTAAAQVTAEPGVVLAGGVESASTAPWRHWPPVDGAEPERYFRAPFAPTGYADPEMGEAADRLAAAYGVGRAAQDAYAARSHARAVAASAAGDFAAEIVPVAGLARDERPRASVTVPFLARLGPAFRVPGTVTLGNSCGINDGAAVVAVVDGVRHATSGAPGLRILASATAGVDPDRPGIGLVPAARLALARAEVTLDAIDVVELNEAFAGQVLACCADLGLDPERVCPQGGALALGHPWGASGAVLLVRLFSQLVRTPRPGALGLAAIAVGGGQGVAMVVESVGTSVATSEGIS